MLKLVDIVKDYRMADSVVHALKGINLNFRKSEFVSILGPSGCGKTTMLNIIGGLDKYTDGDLIINEKSTKEFKSRDWDAYRNRSIGFVFQSYNLIPHLNILQNVELALTISGVPHKKKKALAINALERVGLGGQIKKKPNQLSGGQMQRVAIARAIVNNPEIILADEPTGALDTKTSEQVMDLLQEIADNRLVIMVTHNPELAKRYSTRIIELTDGGVIADSNPYDGLPTILSPVAPISDGEPSPIEQYIKECAELPEPVEEVAVPVKKAPAKKSKKGKKQSAAEEITTTTEDVEGETKDANANTLALAIDKAVAATMKPDGDNSESSGEAHDEKFVAVLSPEHPEPLKKRSGQPKKKKERTSMSFFTALSLSARNLITKRTRTFLTAFAGSIGIIGIALVLSLSNGFNLYMDEMEGSILSSMPLTINSMALDIDVDELMNMQIQGGSNGGEAFPDSDYVTPYKPDGFINGITFGANVLTEEYIDYVNKIETLFPDELNSIKYTYGYKMPVLVKDYNGNVKKVNSSTMSNPLGWQELLWDKFMQSQYDVIAGGYPGSAEGNAVLEKYDENYASYDDQGKKARQAVLVVSSYNTIDYEILETLGMRLQKDDNDNYLPVDFNDILGRELVVASNNNYYDVSTAGYVDTDGDEQPDKFNPATVNTDYASYYDAEDNITVRIVGVLRITQGILAPLLSSGVAYTQELTELCIANAHTSEIVALQEANKEINVLTGETFELDFSAIVSLFSSFGVSENTLVNMLKDAIKSGEIPGIGDIDPDKLDACQTINDVVRLLQKELGLSSAMIELMLRFLVSYINQQYGLNINANAIITLINSAYENAMQSLGGSNMPTGVYIYPTDFTAKDKICAYLDAWNDDNPSMSVTYTDYAGTISELLTRVVGIVSYILIAFAAISLVVSSVMIAIITYVSVLERTTEIGVLRSIGARKIDVSNVFNAETGIIGTVSGVLGVFLAWIIDFPINAWISTLAADAPDNFAVLNPLHALLLVALSIGLTMISGLVPAILAAKKDPVKALRASG